MQRQGKVGPHPWHLAFRHALGTLLPVCRRHLRQSVPPAAGPTAHQLFSPSNTNTALVPLHIIIGRESFCSISWSIIFHKTRHFSIWMKYIRFYIILTQVFNWYFLLKSVFERNNLFDLHYTRLADQTDIRSSSFLPLYVLGTNRAKPTHSTYRLLKINKRDWPVTQVQGYKNKLGKDYSNQPGWLFIH